MRPSRAMITGELYMAFIALCFAWSGLGLWPLDGSYLNRVLDKTDRDEWWGAVIGIPALLLIYFSGREWIQHRWPSPDFSKRWTPADIEKSAVKRAWLCLVLTGSWAYIVYVLIKVSASPSSVLPISAGSVVFSLWFFVENWRVRREYREQTLRMFTKNTAG